MYIAVVSIIIIMVIVSLFIVFNIVEVVVAQCIISVYMITHEFKWNTDSNLNVNYNWDSSIAETCIIAIADNAHSHSQSCAAIESCHRVGQVAPRIFYGYDGTDSKTIHTPDHLVGNSIMSWIKVLDTRLSITEVACALSHIAAWVHCISIDRPIVVLEHDALMLRSFNCMTYTNSLEYLGNSSEIPKLYKETGAESYAQLVEYYLQKPEPDLQGRLPIIMSVNYNYLFSHGLHAYAIDPFMARRLVARVLTEGLINPIDVVVEVTDFTLVQSGIYAVTGSGSKISTISSDNSDLIARGRKSIYSMPGVG